MKMLHKSTAQIVIQYLPLVSFALKFAHHNTTTSSLVSSAIIQWHDIKQMLRQSCKLPILSKNLLLMKLSTIYLDQIVNSNLLAVWWAGRKMRLKMIELLQEVLLGEVAVLLCPDVAIVGQHSDNLHVLDLASELLNFLLKRMTGRCAFLQHMEIQYMSFAFLQHLWCDAKYYDFLFSVLRSVLFNKNVAIVIHNLGVNNFCK